VGSISKAFNGAVALALVDRGVLHLRDTIGRVLPGLPRRWHRVTLREMLLHTSGLPNFTASPKYMQALVASPQHPPRPRGLLRFVAHDPLDFPAGTKYEYSNTDNVVIGLMVQKVTGRSYFHEMERFVLRPLHLGQTSMPRGSAIPRPYVHGYDLDEKTNRPTEDVSHLVGVGWFWASGAVVSTPGNVSGRLLSPRLRRIWHRMFIPASGSEPAGPGFESAGLGVFRYQTPCGTMYGHTGNLFGYTNFALSTLNGSRSATVSVSIQSNQQGVGQKARVFSALSRVVQAAVCTASR
jgi:D-alanyl-D-alanine carboxypeptidase